MSTQEQVKSLRNHLGLSQEEVAMLLNMSRLTYGSIESGKRELKQSEIEKLAQIFEISIKELMGSSEKSGASKPLTSKHSKMINVILYILAKCAGKPNMGKIVLNKLLYFIDFNFHEKYHESLTGEDYIKMPMGPVPEYIEDIIAMMKEHGLVDQVEGEYFGYTQVRLIPKAEPDLKALNGEELAEIEYVINQYGDKTGKRLTDFSHGDAPWRVTPHIGDKISYNYAHYRDPLYRVTSDEEDD